MKTQLLRLDQFIDASPSPWHAAELMVQLSNLPELNELSPWPKPPKDFCVRRGASVAMVRFPEAPIHPEQLQFHIVGAHTDSPCLRLKPQGPPPVAGNMRQWGVEIYGGVLLNSWLDRDLGVAGRCQWMENGQLSERLVRMDDWAWRVPQLAIHLDRDINREGLKLNPQNHLVPICGLDEGELWQNRLLQQCGLTEKPMGFQFDLVLFDRQGSRSGGMDGEFIYAPRLDNLAMCHAGLAAINEAKPADNSVDILCCFHHEEVGSVSTEGAASTFLPHLLERICLQLELPREAYLRSLRRSFMVSADMAHALHPNYSDRHEPEHRPLMGKGPVLKGNVNARYAGSGSSHSRFCAWAEQSGVGLQNFVCRTDMGCGSTIGPCLASSLGMDVVDVGSPLLSMHSIREMASWKDHDAMIKVLTTFFSH
jgi:aspartyl aminopeptidase